MWAPHGTTEQGTSHTASRRHQERMRAHTQRLMLLLYANPSLACLATLTLKSGLENATGFHSTLPQGETHDPFTEAQSLLLFCSMTPGSITAVKYSRSLGRLFQYNIHGIYNISCYCYVSGFRILFGSTYMYLMLSSHLISPLPAIGQHTPQT